MLLQMPKEQIQILIVDDSYTEIAKAVCLGHSDDLIKGKKDHCEACRYTSPKMQILKLLKIVEELIFSRVGECREIPTDARFIFATTKNLSELVEKGLFCADLYMMISAFELQIPKHSEDKEDIPEIIRHMIKKVRKEIPIKIVFYEQFSEGFIDFLTHDQIKGSICGVEHDVIRLILYFQSESTGQLHLKNWKSVLAAEPKIIKKKNPVVINEHLDLKTFMGIENNLLSEFAVGLKELRELFEKKVIKGGSCVT